MPTLRTLLNGLSATLVGNPEIEITGIAYDSRRVRPGDLFACLPGTTVHGQQFIPQVIAAGASALLVEDAAVVPPGVSAIVASDVRETLAWLAAAFYGQPCDALTVIGVTGTKGKTTTTTLIRAILEEAGHPTGLIGTIAYHIGNRVIDAPHTTPQAPDLQALLAEMRDAGVTHVVMEVSSHALCLHRVTGCRFSVAAFTNLSQDHLDFHGTMDAYRDAKIALFADPRYQPADAPMVSLLNADDPATPQFARQALGRVQQFGLGAGDYQATDLVLHADGSRFTFCYPGGTQPVHMPLVGAFNIANALTALAVAVALGIDPAQAAATLATIPPVDGRFQRLATAPGLPTVVVDYAHSPDSLAKVLATAEEIAPGRVVVLFGCGGDRDRDKRPKMAAIAAHGARQVYVTSDNPRTEDPAQIIADVLTGFTPDDLQRVMVEPDRATAIRRAILDAPSDAFIILAGKGHETYQILGTTKIHFDDREAALHALAIRSRVQDGGDG